MQTFLFPYISPTLITHFLSESASGDEAGSAEDLRDLPSASQVSKGGAGAKKGTYTLSPEQEEQVVEWLQGNDFLWLRSSRDYSRKKAAWECKAKELNITLQHLEKWWKNTKDWYVKVKKGKSGQGARRLTDRDRWLLTHLAFYNSEYTYRDIYLRTFLTKHLSTYLRIYNLIYVCKNIYHSTYLPMYVFTYLPTYS